MHEQIFQMQHPKDDQFDTYDMLITFGLFKIVEWYSYIPDYIKTTQTLLS